MARLSDIIEEFIKELLEESDSRELEIGRNELANQFRCAPSQISYVLTTRFSENSGYYIESRRGGGGFIKIKKIQYDTNETLLKLIIEKIGDNITCDSAYSILDGLAERKVITYREANIIKVAINDRILMAPVQEKNNARAQILKTIIKVALL
jgi:transcriptional regulator CtsR